MSIQGINWFLFCLCVIAFLTRAYIRINVFRHLLAEDWLMLATLLLLAGTEGMGQHFGTTMWHILAWVQSFTSAKSIQIFLWLYYSQISVLTLLNKPTHC